MDRYRVPLHWREVQPQGTYYGWMDKGAAPLFAIVARGVFGEEVTAMVLKVGHDLSRDARGRIRIRKTREFPNLAAGQRWAEERHAVYLAKQVETALLMDDEGA